MKLLPLHADKAVQVPDTLYKAYFEVVDEKISAEPVCDQLSHYTSQVEGLVLYGSCQTLMGRDAWLPWNKMRYVNEGLVHIERALTDLNTADNKRLFQGIPVYVFVWMMAASNYLNLPDNMFHTRQRGLALLEKIKAQPLNTFPNIFQLRFQALLKQVESES